jgi:hypothetical protein
VNPTESENIEFFHEMRSICTLVTPALTPHWRMSGRRQ